MRADKYSLFVCVFEPLWLYDEDATPVAVEFLDLPSTMRVLELLTPGLTVRMCCMSVSIQM